MDNASDVGGSTLDVRVTAAIRARVNPCHGSRRPRRVGYRGRGGPTELAENAGFADEDRLYQPEESSLVAQLVIDAGATGFVVRDRVDTELVTAVRLTARRERYVSARVARGLQAVCQATGDDGLTRRETEIVRMIALGHTGAEIARQLDLSRRTVATHRARILNKLGFTTRAELVQFALRRRLIGA